MTTPPELDGPRSLRTGEMPALRALESTVFRSTMPDEYPQVFNDDNYENLTVCFDGARCVSHVGMVPRGASILGCRIDVGLIGGVATDPEYRGRGLAGACVDHAIDQARRAGIDLLLVSGSRSLYLRRDCVAVGQDTEFTLAPSNVPDLAALDLPRVRVEPLPEADLPLIRAAYGREPVRFLRHAEDYTDLYRCGVVLNAPSEFFGVRDENGAFLAYLIAPRRARPDGAALIAEFGGDRRAALAALPHLLPRYDGAPLRLHVARHDTLLHALLTRAGIPASAPVPASGTVRIVHFPQLMERLRPLFVETLGRAAASRFAFAEEGDTCIVRFAGKALRVGRADAARLLFGTPDAQDEPKLLAALDREMADALRAVLPVPALWYGLSYV